MTIDDMSNSAERQRLRKESQNKLLGQEQLSAQVAELARRVESLEADRDHQRTLDEEAVERL